MSHALDPRSPETPAGEAPVGGAPAGETPAGGTSVAASVAAADRPVREGVPVLEARDLHVHFDGTDGAGRRTTIRAIDGVDLTLYPGQITALVGESGSGKTTIARVFSLIYKPTSGEILYNGTPIRIRGGRAERAYYRSVQLVYQDPFASLNGLKKIRSILGRVVRIHNPKLSRAKVEARVVELLETVHLSPASRYLDRYPTDLSGGQRQRIAIARALAVDPAVLLADEPTSMLDASIRLDVLNLLQDLRRDRGVAVLYITHDIASARYLSDRINVMYHGRLVEGGPTEDIITDPIHPYTRLLLGAAPDPARFKGSGRSTAEPAAAETDPSGAAAPGAASSVAAIAAEDATELPTFTSLDGSRTVRCWSAAERPDFRRTA